jgi:hypothetical protein
MKNSTYSRRSHTVSTVKKSQARIPVAAERFADRGRRHLHAEPDEFAFDPLVAPARVLGGQADDQLLEVLVELRSARSTAGIGPGACDQAAVPAQQCLRLDQEARPAGPREQATNGSQQGTVGGFELGSRDLAA